MSNFNYLGVFRHHYSITLNKIEITDLWLNNLKILLFIFSVLIIYIFCNNIKF